MPTIEEFIQGKSPLTPLQIYRLRELVADWQLLSDLSFADLILWVPLRKDMESTRKEINSEFTAARREINREVEQLKREVDNKIQKAIDNPLANK